MKFPEEMRKAVLAEALEHFETQTQMARFFGVSCAAVTKWKRNGAMPNSQMLVTMFRIPELAAWKNFSKEAQHESAS